jgi:hypothetical protein
MEDEMMSIKENGTSDLVDLPRGHKSIGIDFRDLHMDSVLLLASAAHEAWEWEVHHLDVASAFLNGDLPEEIDVEQPPGFVKIGEEGRVVRLHKAMYGVRQAPRV